MLFPKQLLSKGVQGEGSIYVKFFHALVMKLRGLLGVTHEMDSSGSQNPSKTSDVTSKFTVSQPSNTIHGSMLLYTPEKLTQNGVPSLVSALPSDANQPSFSEGSNFLCFIP